MIEVCCLEQASVPVPRAYAPHDKLGQPQMVVEIHYMARRTMAGQDSHHGETVLRAHIVAHLDMIHGVDRVKRLVDHMRTMVVEDRYSVD